MKEVRARARRDLLLEISKWFGNVARAPLNSHFSCPWMDLLLIGVGFQVFLLLLLLCIPYRATLILVAPNREHQGSTRARRDILLAR